MNEPKARKPRSRPAAPTTPDPEDYWGHALVARGDEAGAIRKSHAAADRAEVVRRLAVRAG